MFIQGNLTLNIIMKVIWIAKTTKWNFGFQYVNLNKYQFFRLIKEIL